MDRLNGRGQEELTASMKKAQAMGFSAISNADGAMLDKAGKLWPQWATEHWKDPQRGLATLPLPAAARAGWEEGVRALAALGADVNAPDACRQGLGKHGRPPLAEAMSKQAWGAAQALIDCGARLEPLPEILWACSFVGWRHGPGAAVESLRWARARGFDAWVGDESAQAAYLFAGGVKGGSEQERETWARELFEGAPLSKEADSRMWHFAFGSASGSVDAPAWLTRAWKEASPDASRWLLEWGLEYGCPGMSGAGAEGLAASRAAVASLGMLEKACSREVGLGGLSFSDEKSARGAAEAFAAAWEHLGPFWAEQPERLAAAANKAMRADNAGLLEGLLRQGGVSALAASRGVDREERRYGGRESKGKVSMASWMAARLREGAAVDDLRSAFDDFREGQWLDRHASFDSLWAQAQRLEVESASNAAPKARAGARL
jgi:hypothetical protein